MESILGIDAQVSIHVYKYGLWYCLMAQEGGGEWYQSINFNKLSCRQVSVFGPKGTPSREKHKTPGRVLTTFKCSID